MRGNFPLFRGGTMKQMRSRFLSNRKWASLLLAFALVIMALPAGASWQCLNGTPCLRGCPMLRVARSASPRHAASASERCSRCQNPVSSFHAAFTAGAAASVCGSSCVLRAQTRPAAALSDKTTLILPLLALPPPAPRFVFPPAKTAVISMPALILFFPQRFLRPASGRAPPVCLA